MLHVSTCACKQSLLMLASYNTLVLLYTIHLLILLSVKEAEQRKRSGRPSTASRNPIIRPDRSADSHRSTRSSSDDNGPSTSGTRDVLHNALEQQQQQQGQGGVSGASSDRSNSYSGASVRGLMPQRLPTQQEQEQQQLQFAEPEWWPSRGLQLASQVRVSVCAGALC